MKLKEAKDIEKDGEIIVERETGRERVAIEW